ncbi:hypothetical protein [Streptomyces sp. TRM49041]|uniref:hypothetical protein n=1 Tax=Streptomyces sp. TRM49041 TaxID=2603216 RepID=UPI00292A47A0|nr:hypothetical protein [Streptomyces sp. TRM49041]
MTVGIIHAFLRFVLGVLAPGSGKRRADTHPTVAGPAAQPQTTPRTGARPLPAHRSPYGLPK